MNKSKVYRLVSAGMLAAIGIILPVVLFHSAGGIAGAVFLPMHIPVLICGLLCGKAYGAGVGILIPLISSAITSRPPLFPTGISMMFELAAYGLIAAASIGLFRKKFNNTISVILSLLTAMLGGRIVMGIANLILLGVAGKAYAFETFMTAAFVTALPGIIIQIILIPLLMKVLENTGYTLKL